MWLVVGMKAESRAVTGGVRIRRRCSECETDAVFVEHESREIFTLYFVDVAGMASRRFLRCGACGAAVITDELEQPGVNQAGTAVGHVASWARRGKEVVTSKPIDERLEEAREGFADVVDGVEAKAAQLEKFFRDWRKR